MRQLQQQVTAQKLALSQAMRHSLSLLQMDAGEVAKKAAAEVRLNPFLRLRSDHRAPLSGGSQRPDEIIAQPETTAEMLLRQIGLIRLDKEQARVARDLVYCLDARGFLTDSTDDLCRYLGTDEATLQKTVTKLQLAVEPTGVFARSLAECFRLQLIERNRFDPLIESLLGRLDLVARGEIDAICAHCGVDREDAIDIVTDIRALNPAPLCVKEVDPDPVRGPDLLVDKDVKGYYTVRLNPGAFPDLCLDTQLFSSVQSVERDAAAGAYYKMCHGSAEVFVAALQKRANMMLRIGQHLCDAQQRFLKTGRVADRVPLTMERTAQALGVHKSTVSRAMAGCLVDAPHGVLQSDAFFVRAVNSEAPGKTRAQALRQLDLFIRTEDKERPLSDQSLAQLMRRRNFGISRRTVTKYRALLGQPGASERRIGSHRGQA